MCTVRTLRRSAAPALGVAAALAFVVPVSAQQLNHYGNPLELAPRATASAITQQDLMVRLYQFAADSMMGRQFGREGNMKGTAYIANELRRLGIEPGGDDGTYFQRLPVFVRKFTDRSTLAVDGRALRWGTDWVATAGRVRPSNIGSAQVIYGGVAGDTVNTIPEEIAAGRIVVLSPRQGAPARGRGAPATARFRNAVAIATIDMHTMSPAQVSAIVNPTQGQQDMGPAPEQAPPVAMRITPQAAAALLGAPTDGMQPGTIGGEAQARFDWVEVDAGDYARNVIGIVRGSDPKLAGQYVAIGAHNDHVGYNTNPVDHDSAYAWQQRAMLMSIVGNDTIRALTPEQRAQIVVNVDSLRRLRPVRLDSISNGADDDGSGSMAVLEIAEAIARASTKPRRSVIFVWQTGEEAGLRGSAYFAENPTVPLDSIVAQINIDMIGRGRAGDLPGGSDDFLGVVGSSMLSTELGTAVADVNRRQSRPLSLDYRFDQDVTGSLGGSYNNIYRRSDHYNYARKGIPIAFFFTGLHGDYHRVTDEPQYIDYPHYTRITNYIHELLVEIANRDRRPAVDKPIT